MAPEVINANKKKNKWYNEKCDMWSIGIIAYTLITRHHPFKIFREEGFKDDLKNYKIDNTKVFECGEFKNINNPHAQEFVKGLLNENF